MVGDWEAGGTPLPNFSGSNPQELPKSPRKESLEQNRSGTSRWNSVNTVAKTREKDSRNATRVGSEEGRLFSQANEK